MSATLVHEPNKLPAGILAVVVHAVFFLLLYFGFSWQTHQPATMRVELWQSLPEEVAVKPPVETKAESSVKPAPAEKTGKVDKPDIALPDKKKRVEKIVEKPDKKKPEVKPVVQKPAEPKPAEKPLTPAAPNPNQQAEREKAEKAAEMGRVVDEYKAKITAKIRRNIVLLPDVAKDARAEFLVTLLPGGSVLKAELKKSSGNPSYDNAVERAILKSDPLPLPADVSLFNRFRELDLVFRPTE